jgi:uncharacterized protein GlcG (DUF336 family)
MTSRARPASFSRKELLAAQRRGGRAGCDKQSRDRLFLVQLYRWFANLRMAVVVVDHAGNVVSADRMDGAALQNIRFAEGKAFASALYRQTTEELGALYKTRPDRYFGIMNMYPGKIYLVGGGVPLTVDDQLVGGVGVAGLPEGVDEKSARAGIAAWMKLRETMKK